MQEVERTTNLLREVEESFAGVPFGNSDFQISNFIINAGLTPERAFRAVCLTMREKIISLKEAFFNGKRTEVDLEELQARIEDPTTDRFAKRRTEIDYDEKFSRQADTEKLINDAVHEIEVLYAYWQKLPHPTRSQFEAAEEDYFKLSLTKQVLGIDGAVGSLENMGYVLNAQGRLQNSAPKIVDSLNASLLKVISER